MKGNTRQKQIDFRLLFESLPGLFMILHTDFTIAAVGREYLTATMRERDELLGHNIFDVFPDNPSLSGADGTRKLQASLEKVLETKKADKMATQRYDVRERGGEEFVEKYWEPFNSPVLDEDGEILYIVHRAEDVTEREMTKKRVAAASKLSEQALFDSKERLRLATETSAIGIWEWNVLTNEIRWDDEMFKIYGVEPTPEHLVQYETWAAAVLPEDLPEQERVLSETVEANGHSRRSFRIFRVSDGTLRHIEAVETVRRNDAGQVEWVVGTNIDITDRRAAEENLRQSEENFRTLADNISQFAWMADATGWIFWYNERWFEYTGTTLEEMQGWGWRRVHHPDHIERVVAKISHSFKTGEPWEDTFPLRSKAGEYRWFLSRALPINDEQGKVVRWFGTNTDVTENWKAEQDARFLSSLGESMGTASEADELFNRVCQLTARHFGASHCVFSQIDLDTNRAVNSHEFRAAGADISLLGAFELSSFSKSHLEKLKAGQVVVVEDAGNDPVCAFIYETQYRPVGAQALISVPIMRNRRWVGSIYIDQTEPRIWEKREIELLTTIAERTWLTLEKLRGAHDRERMLELEQNLRIEAEKANRLKDEFLATVSHELRTPLNAILGWTTIVRQRNFEPETMRQSFEVIERNAHHQERIVGDILDVSRIINGKLNLEFESVNLGQLIKATNESVRALCDSKKISLQAGYSCEVQIIGDSSRLQQVIWNLLSNAVKFTPPGGTVTVLLNCRDDHAEITVTDTGEGIGSDFLPYVFESFRQADGKSNRKHGGLGLGLSIVRHIVEFHGGNVSATSDGVGRGATFTVRLPLAAAGSESSNAFETNLSGVAGEESELETFQNLAGRRVLVVDDEPDALEILKIMLESRGAQVGQAASAREALQKLRREKFQLIISDLGMPGEDGFELIRKIKKLKAFAKLPAVAVSAYAGKQDRYRALEAGFDEHLPKPVKDDELLRVIQGFFGKELSLSK